MLIGGQVIRKNKDPEIEFPIDFKITIFPVDIYGDSTYDSKDFELSIEHKIQTKCRANEELCELNIFALYPELSHPIYKIELLMNLDD